MAIRTVSWMVADDMSVTPTSIQNAGVQGDDGATLAEFTVPAALQSGYDLFIELTSAMGEYDKTDALPLSGGKVSFLLPLEWTQDGGKAVLRLVAVEQTAEGVEPATIHSREGRIAFSERATGFARVQSLLKGSIHRLMEKCEKVANRVEDIVTNFAENVKDTVAGKCYQIIERNRQVPLDMWVGTAEEYEADGSKRNNTFCAIVDEDNIWRIEDGGTGADTAEEALKNFGVADYIVEHGKKDGWTYVKKNSGIAECWGTFYLTFPNKTEEGVAFSSTCVSNLYVAGVEVTLPFAFLEGATATGDCPWHYTDWIQCSFLKETNQIQARRFFGGNSLNVTSIQVAIQVKGHWK